MIKVLIGAALSGMLAGCVSTSEIPLLANVWQLETEGRGSIGSSIAQQQTLKRAAELTRREGYTHFVLADPEASNSAQVVGRTPVYATTRSSTFGNFGTATTKRWMRNRSCRKCRQRLPAVGRLKLHARDPQRTWKIRSAETRPR